MMSWVFAHIRQRASRVALLGALLGCGLVFSPVARAQHAAGPVTITYWQQWTDPVQKAAITKVIALFEKSHPLIRVHEVDISSDQKILTAISGGRPPDAATMWLLQNLGEWAARGAIQNLDPLIKSTHTDLSDYLRSGLNLSTYQGHLYGLPIEIDDMTLFVNPDLFHAAGLTTYPRTMSEVLADAVKLTKKDSAGRITQLGLEILWTGGFAALAPYFGGGSWYDAAHRTVTPDTPGNVRALEWEKAWEDKVGVQAAGNFEQSKAHNATGIHFVDGTSAMAFTGEFGCTLFPAYNKKLHMAILPPPYADGHPEWQNSTFEGGSINVIPTGAAHPQEAFQFIQFMGTTPGQLIVNRTWSSVPISKRVSRALDNGCMKRFIDLAAGPRAFSWPVLPVANDYLNAVGTAEDRVLHGKDTAQHALAQVRQQIQPALMAAMH